MHVPRRQSLVVQLSEILVQEVRRGRWGEWLPEERELARQFQVSRFTVRCSLSALREQGFLETIHGMGTRVIKSSKAGLRSNVNTSVGVLLPKTLERFRHFVTLIVDDLRTLLFDRGHYLMIHAHPQVEARRPFEFLKKLVDQQRHACWLLVACGPETRHWFGKNRIPTVVSGSCEASLGIPFVCLDNHALGRHAGLTLLQHGHRQIGALLTHSNPGLHSGLHDVLGMQSDRGVNLTSFDVNDSVENVSRAVDRLMGMNRRPTALFVAESNYYLTVVSRLMQLGFKVPDDVSLLCRDDEPYLASLLPEPARYSKNPHLYAKLLLNHVLKLVEGEPVANPGTYMMPEFVTGASLGRLAD